MVVCLPPRALGVRGDWEAEAHVHQFLQKGRLSWKGREARAQAAGSRAPSPWASTAREFTNRPLCHAASSRTGLRAEHPGAGTFFWAS